MLRIDSLCLGMGVSAPPILICLYYGSTAVAQ